MNQSLKWYKKNKEEICKHIYMATCFDAIDNVLIKEVRDEEYTIIAEIAYRTYLKDESKLGLREICDFVLRLYDTQKISLEELKLINCWKLLEMINDDLL